MLDPFNLPGSPQLGLGLLGQREEEPGVLPVQGLGLSAFLQLLSGVLLDRFQHGEAIFGPPFDLAQQVLVYEGSHAVQSVTWRVARGRRWPVDDRRWR